MSRSHPEAKHAKIRERIRLATERTIPPDGWYWPLGWRIKLFSPNAEGGFTVSIRETSPSSSYEEAKALRDKELATGLYEMIWMERIH